MAKKNINLSDWIDDVLQFHYDVLEHAAETARDMMVESAIESIDDFYNSYCGPHKPKYYKRMFRNFGYSGGPASKRSYDSRVIKPIFKIDAEKMRASAGVELTSAKMFDDYRDSVDEVFWDVIKGYHGPRLYSPVPPMKEPPIDIIEETRDAIENHFDFYMRQSVNYVKANKKYKTLDL